jgi:glycosyltransferase involved in cell wall biosynthesis
MTQKDEAAKNAKRGRVPLFSAGPLFGGAEAYCVKLARLLGERYEVGAAVADAQLQEKLKALGLRTWTTKAYETRRSVGRYRGLALCLARAIREFKPDLVHLNGQAECYLSAIPFLCGKTIICTRHVPFNEHIRGLRRMMVAANLRLAAKVICVSSLVHTQLSTVIGEKKLITLPNWLDSLPRLAESSLPGSEKSFRLLYVGRIETIKGIFDLIEAMRQVKNATLDVVGTGGAMEEARAAATGLPITFHGFQSDCGPYYRAADLLVFPSHPDLEGQGQVPFEAMAHGLPCLISNIEVALETADGGACAEVYPWGDSAALARKIASLRSKTARLRELREKGLARVASTYTVEAVRATYFELFDQLVQRSAQ